MWRALFLALGAFSCILGLESLFVEKAIMVNRATATGPGGRAIPVAAKKELVPPAWAPWGLMSVGSVVILYSFTVPEKLKS